jgi:AAA family ATP:ADP antiporter
MTHSDRHPVAASLTIGAAAFFLLCGYEFVRSVSTSLFIDVYGTERLPIVMALSPVGTLALLYGYGWMLSRIGARRTLFLTSILSGLGIAVCYAAIQAGSDLAVGAVYILREAYIVLLIEQYWSFINSTLDGEQARRYNGPICGIASVGAICGGLVVGQVAQSLGSEQLLLFAAVSLAPAALLTLLAYRLGGEPVPTKKEEGGTGALGLEMFRRHRTLVLLAGLVILTQIVSTVLDLRFSGLLEEAMPAKDERTAFLGNFYALLNGVAFILQVGAAPLLLRYLPLRLVHAGIPLIHLLSCAVLLAHPVLVAGAGAYLVFKALDYSVFRAGKEILYIPLPFDARYRSKEVIDAFGYRSSKGGVSGLLAVAGEVVGRLPGGVYPILGLVSAGVWLLLVLRLIRPGSTVKSMST